MSELITVIVPVYNVEKYLHKCLDSIINQTYNNLEIIIINNGSTDKSYEICEEYAKKDDRIILINEPSKGVSKARNIGMNYATGDYIIFIDSDDWLEYDMIECLYRGIVEEKADISICEYYLNTDKEQFTNNELTNKRVIENKKEMYTAFSEEKLFGGYLWNKLIKREIIDTKFNENIQIQEDMLFLVEIIKNTKKIIYKPAEKKYHYRQRNDSAVVFQYSKKDITRLYVLEELIKIYEKYMLPFLSKAQYEYYMLARKSKYIIKKRNIEDKILKNKIESISKEYFSKAMKAASFKGKIRVCLLAISPDVYCKLSEKRLKAKLTMRL